MSDPWGLTRNERPQDPYGAPAPRRFDPNAVGAHPYPYPYPYPVVRPPDSNGLALAGALSSFVPVVGLVLSVAGLVRAKTMGGAGRTAGTLGVVLSLLFSAGWGFLGYRVAHSTVADPGCITAEAGVRNMLNAVDSDDQAFNEAAQAGDQAELTAAEQRFLTDLRNLEARMDRSESIAIHANVRAAIAKTNTDLATVVDLFQQILAGGATSVAGEADSLDAAAQALAPDGDALDKLCGNPTNS